MADGSPLGAGFEVHITRTFKAPAELVFDCFVDPDRLARWWGPLHCENQIYVLDARPGGELSLHMAGPGYSHTMGGEYVEIDRPRRLVFKTKAFKAPEGGWGIINRNTLTFVEKDGWTTIHLHTLVERAAGELVLGALGGMRAGWGQSLERLGDLVGGGGKMDLDVGERSIVLSRAFDAAPELVEQALAKPPVHLAMTQGFDANPEIEVVHSLSKDWGRAVLTHTMTFPDNGSRDAMLQSGFERGAMESYDILAEVLAEG